MPFTKAAFKHLRQTKKITERNKLVKASLKTTIKKSRQALNGQKLKEAKDLIAKSIKALDRAAQKKIIKKNTASRRKSQLMKNLNALVGQSKK